MLKDKKQVLNHYKQIAKLMNSARQKSTDMASNGYFFTYKPDIRITVYQMKANGISYKSAAENIAMGQRTAEEVVKGWIEILRA